jgi:hypothetical protein
VHRAADDSTCKPQSDLLDPLEHRLLVLAVDVDIGLATQDSPYDFLVSVRVEASFTVTTLSSAELLLHFDSLAISVRVESLDANASPHVPQVL